MWSPGSREPRAARARGRRRTGALTAVVLAAAAPGAAHADVLVQSIATDPDAAAQPATLLASDGTRRALAAPGGSSSDAYELREVSPDRRTLAGPRGTRIALLPTDGGPPRIIGRGDLRAAVAARPPARDPGFGEDGTLGAYSFIGAPTVWWDADGSHVLRGDVRTPAGTPVVQTCDVATGTCSTRSSPRGLGRIGARADGGSLWTADTPTRVERYVGFGGLGGGEWVRATPAAVRRARAALRTPYGDQLLLVGPDGSRRVIWRSRRSFARGSTSFDASAPGPGGTIVRVVRTAYAVRTRTRKGRLQARLRTRTVARGTWRISPSGRRTTFRTRGAAGDRDLSVDAPAGPHGWYGGVRDRRGRFVPVLVDDAGTVRRVPLAGRALTPAALASALGLPAATRDRSVSGVGFSGVFASGYEAATDSMVVTSYDVVDQEEGVRQVVARVPLGGGAPSLVASRPEPLSDDASTVQVTAW